MLVDDVTEQQNTEEVSKRLLEEKLEFQLSLKLLNPKENDLQKNYTMV